MLGLTEPVPHGFGEREKSPRSMRWPKDIARRIDDVATLYQQDFSTVAFYLVRWALDERERQLALEKKTG